MRYPAMPGRSVVLNQEYKFDAVLAVDSDEMPCHFG